MYYVKDVNAGLEEDPDTSKEQVCSKFNDGKEDALFVFFWQLDTEKYLKMFFQCINLSDYTILSL